MDGFGKDPPLYIFCRSGNRAKQAAEKLDRRGIVATGVLLAYFVNPAFMWLSGFIGGGLVVTGLTGWCGMGMLIAKMPWNQRGGSYPN